MYQWWYTAIITFIHFSSPLIKNSSSSFSTPPIKNSDTFHFFQLHNKKFNMITKDVYKILGHCIPPEQNLDQMFGQVFKLEQMKMNLFRPYQSIKDLEKIYSMMMLKLKTLSETSNMVYVNEKVFNKYDILYIVEKVFV